MLLLTSLSFASTPDGPWEQQTLQTESLQVHLLVAGPPDAPPVVLLHGFPDSAYGWRHVLPDLAQDHRVYAPDLRGYGGTDKPDDGYELHVLANDVVELLDALELDRVDLIGHDWGAAITWEVAVRAPERLNSITVLSVPHPKALQQVWETHPAQRDYKKFANLMTRRITPRIIAGIDQADRGPDVYMPELVDDSVFTEQDAAHYHALLDTVAEATPPLRYYRTNFGSWRDVWARAEATPAVDVPTLVLWGEQDSYMLVENAQASCDQVTAPCQVAVTPDAGHWLHWEQGPWVAEQWRAFQAQRAD